MKVIYTKNISLLKLWLTNEQMFGLDEESATYLTKDGTLSTDLDFEKVKARIIYCIDIYGRGNAIPFFDGDGIKNLYKFRVPTEHNLNILTMGMMKHIQKHYEEQ